MIEFLTPVSKPVIAHREVLPAGTIGKRLLVHTIKGELPDLEDGTKKIMCQVYDIIFMVNDKKQLEFV